jgi:hypothetical protein
MWNGPQLVCIMAKHEVKQEGTKAALNSGIRAGMGT